MSNSIAAAKRRRAGIIEQPPPAPSSSPSSSLQQQIPARLTFQQVISMLDARLIKLETNTNTNIVTAQVTAHTDDTNVSISEYISEMDGKFNMLVEEITNLKDIVMKLQSYTMDVNKMLTEERIHIMSEFTLTGPEPTLDIEPRTDNLLTQNIKVEIQELEENSGNLRFPEPLPDLVPRAREGFGEP